MFIHELLHKRDKRKVKTYLIINFCDCMVYMVIQVEILILDNVESKQKSKLSHLF